MSRSPWELSRAVWSRESGLSCAERAVLWVLIGHDGSGGCWPSRDLIAAEAGLSLATAKRVLSKLAAQGLITVENRAGKVSLYTLNPAHHDPAQVDPAQVDPAQVDPQGAQDEPTPGSPRPDTRLTVTPERAQEHAQEHAQERARARTARQRAPRFEPPTVAEVAAYVAEKGYTFSPEAFLAHYEANGWKVGSNRMRNWRAACVTWQHRERNGTRPTPSTEAERLADRKRQAERIRREDAEAYERNKMFTTEGPPKALPPERPAPAPSPGTVAFPADLDSAIQAHRKACRWCSPDSGWSDPALACARGRELRALAATEQTAEGGAS